MEDIMAKCAIGTLILVVIAVLGTGLYVLIKNQGVLSIPIIVGILVVLGLGYLIGHVILKQKGDDI